jgi:hypothetical protein
MYPSSRALPPITSNPFQQKLFWLISSLLSSRRFVNDKHLYRRYFINFDNVNGLRQVFFKDLAIAGFFIDKRESVCKDHLAT